MTRLAPDLEGWLQQFHSRIATLMAQGFKPTPTNAREGLALLTRQMNTRQTDLPWVQDDLVAGSAYDVPIRIYHPVPNAALPVLVYLHGGGHMAGSVSVYDPICRRIARHTRHVVVSVDYRRAPECPFPAAVEDACQVVKHIRSTLDGRDLVYMPRVSIAGDSGGGALCATVAHRMQDDPQVHIHSQALIYPSLDYTLSLPSVKENGRGYLLEEDKIRWYFDNYFQGSEDRKAASPLFMSITPRLPRTLVIAAGFCPLRDEGAAYVERIQTAGGRAELLLLDDAIHAFLNLEDLCAHTCLEAYDKLNTFLNA